MAELTDVRLDISDPYVDNGGVTRADVTIDFDVNWDRADRVTRQAYRGSWTMWGKDAFAAEDGVDERLFGNAAHRYLEVTSNGSASGTHAFNVPRIRWDRFDEDNAGYDEIYATVTLTPLDPMATSRNSPHVNLVVG